MHRGEPAGPGHRGALRIRYRDQVHVVEFAKQRIQIGNIEPAMQSGDCGNLEPSNLREREVVEVKVHNIEFVRILRNRFDEIEVVGERRKQLTAVESKGSFANGSKTRRCLRISTRVKGYLMAQLYKLFRNIRDHSLCPAIKLGGHTFV